MTALLNKLIIDWYEKNKRILPWREQSDPYKIWISEIILQQTRVNQGMNHYLNFVSKFPDIRSLANASQDAVLLAWQGLGYYSRARNLHAAANQIVLNFNGELPPSFEQLKTLKGVGSYTAAAIASIAFNIPIAAIDGNVIRVVARIFGIEQPVNLPATSNIINHLANEILDMRNPGIYNQAMMELGATICTPKNPKCNNCVLIDFCDAKNKNIQHSIPIKTKKATSTNRYFNYLVINYNNTILLKQRTEKDIWQQLFEFPLIESTESITLDELILQTESKNILSPNNYVVENISPEYKHVLTHQNIYATFYTIRQLSEIDSEGLSQFTKYNRHQIKEIALPRLIEKYFERMV